MDYEKLHKDTIANLQEMVNSGKITVETACGICADFVPESEDERIRKEIISLIKGIYQGSTTDSAKSERDKYVAWLEKQGAQPKKHDVCDYCDQQGSCVSPCCVKLAEKNGEQNPAWSEEDEKMSHYIENALNYEKPRNYLNIKGIEVMNAHSWLKSLKDRVQPKQGWSEEDENNILFLTSIIKECFKDKEKITLYSDTVCANFTKEDVIDRLKSLRPQSQWKPSDEQMKALDDAIDICSKQNNEIGDWLDNLREQLKKLKGEEV